MNLDKPITSISEKSEAIRSWLTVKPDDSIEMRRRIEAANQGNAWTENDRRIAELKNKHQGKIAFLLGNGPSVRIEDLERLKDAVVIGCNRLYLAYKDMTFRPLYLCSSDQQVITDFGADMVANHPGTVFFIAEESPQVPGNFVWFRKQSRTPLEFSENVYDFVMPGGGTLIAAIQIAYHMGVTKFFLYGIDHNFTFQQNKDTKDVWHTAVGDGNHFIPNYRSGKAWARPVLSQVEGAFLSCQVFLQSKGGWIKNATRGGKLEILERMDFDQAVKMALNQD